MATKPFECFGGPMDGKTMELDEATGEDMCMLHLDRDQKPHFYVTIPKDNVLVLEYAGTSPYDAVKKLRANGCPDADEIEERLDTMLGRDD